MRFFLIRVESRVPVLVPENILIGVAKLAG